MLNRISAIVFTIVFATASPAFAHEKAIYQGYDEAWVGENHLVINVTDIECDSHAVTVFWKQRLVLGTFKQKDTDGCKGDGNLDTAFKKENRITKFKLCEYWDENNTWHCTAWKDS